MAHTIFFEDGSCEILFHADTDTEGLFADLEQILSTRLGKDTAWLLHLCFKNYEEDTEEKLLELHTDCDQYRNCLQNISDDLRKTSVLLNNKKPDCGQLNSIINHVREQIQKALSYEGGQKYV